MYIARAILAAISLVSHSVLAMPEETLYSASSKAQGKAFELVVTEEKREPKKSYLRVPGFHSRTAQGSRWLMCVYTELAIKRGFSHWNAMYLEYDNDLLVVGFSDSASTSPQEMFGPQFNKERLLGEAMIPTTKLLPLCETKDNPSSVIHEAPSAADFYYCAEFYRWLNGRPEFRSELHLHNSQNYSRTVASILSGGALDFAQWDAATATLKAALNRAADEKMSVGEFASKYDASCRAKQSRHIIPILTKSIEIGQQQRPYSTHILPGGEIGSDEIARHQERLKSVPNMSISSKSDTVTYWFSKKIKDDVVSYHHVFTKTGHPAHPAIMFLERHSDKKNASPSLIITGSYAGSKKEFDIMHQVLFMMNQGL